MGLFFGPCFFLCLFSLFFLLRGLRFSATHSDPGEKLYLNNPRGRTPHLAIQFQGRGIGGSQTCKPFTLPRTQSSQMQRRATALPHHQRVVLGSAQTTPKPPPIMHDTIPVSTPCRQTSVHEPTEFPRCVHLLKVPHVNVHMTYVYLYIYICVVIFIMYIDHSYPFPSEAVEREKSPESNEGMQTRTNIF